jgi:dipeptidyl aminopeptidase/acylaminoacyl peptidase
LLDRELFFGDPEMADAQLSPDGKYLTFLRGHQGQLNVWIKGQDEPFSSARPLTADTARPVTRYLWSRDGRFVLYVQDKGGDENYHVFAVDPSAANESATGVPRAADLTPYSNVRAEILALPKNSPNQILVGLNDRNPELHDVYRLDLQTGKRTLVRQNDQRVVSWGIDHKGKIRTAERMGPNGELELLRVQGESLEPFYTCTAEESCSVVGIHRDGKRVYLNTNHGEHDRSYLALVDLKTGRETLVESDPNGEVDLAYATFSDVTHELSATAYEGDKMRVYPKSPAVAKDYETVRAALPGFAFDFVSTTADENLQIVVAYSDIEPGATYLYDRKKATVTALFRSRPNLPSEHLATRTPVHYAARDGLRIDGYLTVPKGVAPKAVPAIVLPHGGPWARDSWGFDDLAQFLANRGYIVLQPNFRASTGYGKRFLNLGNRQWGTGTMQHDLTDGAKWLASQGLTRTETICIMGGSYGGYATLAGLAFTPDVFRCGVDVVGPSSLITLLDSIPPYWAPLKKMFHTRMGDESVPKERQQLIEQSPLHSAAKIDDPLLIIQGANDPRVKKAESDQMVAALRDLGRNVEYVLAPDEGHGFAGRENRIAMFAIIERFLATHLGGRHQSEMPEAIGKRVREITVDIKSVNAPQPAAVSLNR